MEEELQKLNLGDPEATQQALEQLTQQLQQAQQGEQQVADKPTGGGELFGMSPGALFAGFIISTLGLACFKYAKSESDLLLFVLGVVLLALPFFVTTTVPMVSCAGGAVALVVLLRRFVRL